MALSHHNVVWECTNGLAPEMGYSELAVGAGAWEKRQAKEGGGGSRVKQRGSSKVEIVGVSQAHPQSQSAPTRPTTLLTGTGQ